MAILEGTYKGQPLLVQLNKQGHVLLQDGFGAYEGATEGRIFGVANQTGVASQAGLSLTTPVLTLYNPLGSGVNGLLLFAGGISLVAYAAAAAIWLAVNTNVAAAAVTGTLTTAHRALGLGKATANKLQALLAATLPAAPVAVATLGAGLTGAITTIPGQPTFGRSFPRGQVVLAPGSAISIQTSTASGAAGLLCEYIWEEVGE